VVQRVVTDDAVSAKDLARLRADGISVDVV
jgi:hypothetical protein